MADLIVTAPVGRRRTGACRGEENDPLRRRRARHADFPLHGAQDRGVRGRRRAQRHRRDPESARASLRTWSSWM
ncbi:MAG: hypothetical protein MZV70_19995 [Desulfobacterales bacterium]|nr:hypothetical protein [Desulfobacterales bacterium]